MRLFTGISVEEAAIPHLSEMRSRIALNWTQPANLHITTKFIGEWPEARLRELESDLARVPFPAGLQIELTGFELPPGLVLAAVQPSAELIALNRATEDALELLGCPREARAYRPHVTLARLRGPAPQTLRETIARMKPLSAKIAVDGFHLYLSRPGSPYTKLATWS